MRIRNLKAAWLMLLPMLATAQTTGQTTDQPPVRRDSVEVHDTAPGVAPSSSAATPVKPADVKDLPSRPATVNDALPLLPGIVRTPSGGLRINGAGEQRSAMLVNESDVTDPATGNFGASVPVDSIQVMNVFRTPFLAQYGRFSSGVVAVETRRGGDRWHFDLNDPFPDFRIRSWHLDGLQDASPRLVVGGPLIEGRLYFAQTILYDVQKIPNRTLPFPDNTSKQERVNSFTQVDYILSSKQYLTGTLHLTPQHINFVNPDFFNPEPVTPSYRQQNYMGTVTDHLALGQGMLDSAISFQRFDANVGAQGAGPMFLLPQGNSGNYFATQSREAGRIAVSETWSPAAVHDLGTHELKFGASATQTSDSGSFTARPINIENAAGQLLQSIDFTGGSPYSHYDVETTVFSQDHWSLAHGLTFDLGTRLERQSISDAFRIAPRAGLSWVPFGGKRTVVQAGYGIFYDRVPLEVYAFDRFPQRVVTNYAPDGSLTRRAHHLSESHRLRRHAGIAADSLREPARQLRSAQRHLECPRRAHIFSQRADSRRIHGQPVFRADSARTGRGAGRQRVDAQWQRNRALPGGGNHRAPLLETRAMVSGLYTQPQPGRPERFQRLSRQLPSAADPPECLLEPFRRSPQPLSGMGNRASALEDADPADRRVPQRTALCSVRCAGQLRGDSQYDAVSQLLSRRTRAC